MEQDNNFSGVLADDNPIDVVKQTLNYIDSLQDAESAKAAGKFLDNNLIKKVFWTSFKIYLTTKNPLEKQKARLKCAYVNRYFGSYIPLNAKVTPFATPHDFYGIFISNAAKIGKGCTLFHHVTIGSNTLLDSKNAGAPTIGDNVFIGAGAKIIGNVTVGNNVRIGAGCCVTRDVPDNCTVVQPAPVVIQKTTPQDNRFINIIKFLKLKAAETTDNTVLVGGGGIQDSKICSPSVRVLDVPEKNIWRTSDSITQAACKDAFKILFCGDLILLEDQVKRAFDGHSYNFDDMFEFTREYISGADFSIGVFEGPLGGTANLYSQSNFADGKKLYLNFPDEFADAVKNAGFDLVTTANNHILDMGLDGARRTIKILGAKKIDFIGSYSDVEDKNNRRVKILERDGIKFAILAYTYGANGFNLQQLMSEKLSPVTSLLAPPNAPEYETILEDVRKDFEVAKSHNPDLIIVLPHWGTQFVDNPDNYQKIWRDNFLSLGADIILGDHTHSVQPVKIETVDGRKTYTLYSPGNYANIYRAHDGDASLLAEVYIDRTTKKIVGGAIIPMWTRSSLAGNYRPLPIYDIMTNDKLRREISTHELNRVAYVLKHITRVTLGAELNLNLIQKRYRFDADGFYRENVAPLKIDAELAGKKFFSAIKAAKDICFVGDSITNGTKNGGVPWYEPIAPFVDGKIFNASFGGATIKRLISEEFLSKIVAVPAELFVVAIGTNDVRYRKPEICAMTPEEYIDCMKKLRDEILKNNSAAKFVFIAPWTSTDGDKVSALRYGPKLRLNNQYTAALKNWCATTGDAFINPNFYIKSNLNRKPHSNYLVDWIHPNATAGVVLYSEAVLKQ